MIESTGGSTTLGPDSIPAVVLQDCIPELAVPVVKLLQYSCIKPLITLCETSS